MHPPTTPEEAATVQREIATRVDLRDDGGAVDVVAGLDISYEVGSDRAVAAAVAVRCGTGEVLDEALVEGEARFPYVPGLLAFREVPLLLEALEALTTPVDLLLCDGQGLAHPQRAGAACHLGVLTGLRSVGCAKNHLVGEHTEPGRERGARSPLVDGGTVVGTVLRTQDGVRPVYVSPGHRIGVERAAEVVLHLAARYRLPDPVRRADHISRQALKK